MLKTIFIKIIKFYQKFISIIAPNKCRYIPSCSEYSIQQFEHNNFLIALFKTITRILSCNQLFVGGFDFVEIPFYKNKTIYAFLK